MPLVWMTSLEDLWLRGGFLSNNTTLFFCSALILTQSDGKRLQSACGPITRDDLLLHKLKAKVGVKPCY